MSLAVVVISGGAFSQPAAAQFFFWDKFVPQYHPPRAQPRVQPHVVRRAPLDAVRVRPPHNDVGSQTQATHRPALDDADRPLIAVISIEDQHVSVYGAQGLIERESVSTGMPGHPTPTGVFAVIGKERWHESNLYSGAPMPFMQRITWSGVAMHEGQLPGYAASHGCIRLSGSFAERWFRMTRLGLRVVISPSEIDPEPITHPLLPVPRTWPASPETASQMRSPVQSAALSIDDLANLAGPAHAELNPVTYAASEKQKAKADLKASEKAESEAGDAVEAASLSLKEAQKSLRVAEHTLAAAEDRLAWFGGTGRKAPPPPTADFGEGLLAAQAAYERARTDAGQAARALSAAESALADATAASERADARTEQLKERISEMGRRQETLSVFISRKDQRLYVRQALKPVFDVPITIRDPDEPLGTHVFVASTPGPGERSLRWTAFSLPVEAVPRSKQPRPRALGEGETASIATAIQTESPAGALSRIEMSGELMDRLGELVWAGSSIIVADRGLTAETGVGTDFVLETKH